MSLRFIDSFDHYATADLALKWTVSGSPSISAGNGRRSTACLDIPSGTPFLTKTLDNQATWIVGFALRVPAVPGGAYTICELLDAGVVQMSLDLGTDLTLRVFRGSTEIGRTTAVLTAATYTYIEWKSVIHNTTGSSVVRLNGATALTLGPLDTQQTANAFANAVRLRGAAPSHRVDDLYICDGTGSAPHQDFLGDCRVDMLLPNADGASTQWTPSTGTTHYTLVDETAPSTTDYVSSSTVGHRDTYGLQDLSAMTGTIYAVQLNLAALKSDAGARSVKPLLLSGASEALGAATALSTGQTYTLYVQTIDPATSAAWAESAINSLQAGAEVA